MQKRLNPEISIGFVVASVFWMAILGWQSSYSLPEQEKRRCYEEAKTTGHKDEECKSFWERTTSDPVAFFTLTLTVVTLALGAISVRQFHYLKRSDETARIAATAAKEAVELTRTEQISNYRPRLRVRNIVVMAANPALVQRMGIIQPNKPVQGQLFVVNVGGSVANIIESHCIVFWGGRGLPMRRPYEGQNGNNSIAATRLEAGQSMPGLFISTELIEGDHLPQIGTKIIGGLQLWVMGWIEYADDRGIKRRTSFCREFEKRNGAGDGRFYAINDPDYEHEE